MTDRFPHSHWRWTPLVALLGAVALAVGLFLVIPLTQNLEAPPEPDLTQREVVVLAPPPPPLPPRNSSPDATLAAVHRVPETPPRVRPVSLSQLELSLDPGLGTSLALGMPGFQFEGGIDALANIERIFDFDELPQAPALLNAGQIRVTFPRELARRGVATARVVLEVLIDKSGRTQVLRVLSSTHDHPALEREARRAAEQARFSVTRVDGQPVQVRGRFPLNLQAPR